MAEAVTQNTITKNLNLTVSLAKSMATRKSMTILKSIDSYAQIFFIHRLSLKTLLIIYIEKTKKIFVSLLYLAFQMLVNTIYKKLLKFFSSF